MGHRPMGYLDAGRGMQVPDSNDSALDCRDNAETPTAVAHMNGRAEAMVESPMQPSTRAPGLAFVPVMIGLYFTAAFAMSWIAGTHFAVPEPGDIPGLGTSYWVPPIAAAAAYLVLQCLGKFLFPERRAWRQIARHAATDYLLLAAFILILYLHFNMKMWIPVINPRIYDQDFYAVDQVLQPVVTLLDHIRGAVARFLPYPDIWYQAAFFAIFVISFLSHGLGRRKFHYHNIVALMLIEMLGTFAYLVAPAVGPFIYEHGSNALATAAEMKMYGVYQHVREGGADWINLHGGAFLADPLAAMPSLHVGATLIVTYYAIRGRLWLAPIALMSFAWIFVESVVARWHYLVDLPVGLLLAIGVVTLTNRLCRGLAAQEDDRGPSKRGKIDRWHRPTGAAGTVPARPGPAG